MSASRFSQFRHPFALSFQISRVFTILSILLFTCCLRQVSLRLKLKTITILAANDNLEIFLAHSTLGRSNFHATPILDLQFRPPMNSFLISSNSTGGRNIVLLNLSFFVLYFPSFAHSILSKRTVLPFSSSFPPHLHPPSPLLTSPLNSPALLLPCNLCFVPSSSFRPPSGAILEGRRLLRAGGIMESENGY